MPIVLTEEKVKVVCKKAKIGFTEEEIRNYKDKLEQVFSYMEALNEVDPEGEEPMTHAIHLENVFREDKPEDGLPIEDVMLNVKEQEDNQIKLPKVVE